MVVSVNAVHFVLPKSLLVCFENGHIYDSTVGITARDLLVSHLLNNSFIHQSVYR